MAFGSRIVEQTLQTTRRAGCDHVWTRPHMMEELPELVQRALHPPNRWVAGWDEPTPPLLLRSIEQFNAGEYWECHETLETLWRAEERPVRDLYQGILQVGVAFHHLKGGNYAGAVKMFRRGLPRLRDLPEACQGVHVAALARAARGVHDAAVLLGPDRLGELDLSSLPKITVKQSASASQSSGKTPYDQ